MRCAKFNADKAITPKVNAAIVNSNDFSKTAVLSSAIHRREFTASEFLEDQTDQQSTEKMVDY